MKKGIFILLFSVVTGFLFAQKFTASVGKNKVAIGEAFQIAFTLNTSGSNFKAPTFSDFDVYSGPNQSSSMQFINGNMSQSISMSYVIAAKKEGKITIGSASIIVDGKKMESNTVTIEVVKASSSNQQSQSNSQNQGSVAGSGDLFSRTIVSKSKAYQGEQITVSHKIFTRLNLRGFQDIKFPDYNGFWSQDLPQQTQINLTQENIDGVAYNVAEMRKTFLFPQRSGTLEIGAMDIKCIVRQRSNRGAQTIFDQIFGGGGYEDVVLETKSKPVKIEVLPLPEANKPDNFNGAVGTFAFKAQVSKEKIKANDAINLNITISGKGNLKLLDPLKISFPDNFETYDPKINDNISVNANGVSGTKTFEYLIIPRKDGNYSLEPIRFSYFDPEKRAYVSLPSPEFNLTVEKGENENENTTTAVTSVAKESVKQLTNDIHYIKTNNITLIARGNYFFGSGIFYAGLITPLLAFISFFAIRKKHIAQNSNVALVKSRKASKMIKKHLANAEQLMNNNKKEDFYDAIFKALYGYLSDKLHISVSDLSKDTIAVSLKNKNVTDDVSQKLMETLNNCEYARYAPSAVTGDLNKIYSETVELITKLEDII